MTESAGDLGGINTFGNSTVSFEHLTSTVSYTGNSVTLDFSGPTGCATGSPANTSTVKCILINSPTPVSGPVGNDVGGNVTGTGITVLTSTINGDLINAGTVAGGIAIDSSTINGQIFDSGIISSGGIFIDSASMVVASTGQTAVVVTGSTFIGGITNAGTLSAKSGVGISVSGVTSFGGGITNYGAIDPAVGMAVNNVSLFSGNIVNAAGGTITASRTGIQVSNVSTFQGNISNAGTIAASSFGILVGGFAVGAPIRFRSLPTASPIPGRSPPAFAASSSAAVRRSAARSTSRPSPAASATPAPSASTVLLRSVSRSAARR